MSAGAIILRGPWLWAWGLWHVAWLGGLMWLGVAITLGMDPMWARVYFAALYTVFLPMELAGQWQNTRKRDGVARTLSEFRQYLPVTYGKGDSPISWKVLGYSGVIDALLVGWIVYPMSQVVGAVLSCMTAVFLVPHLGWRGRGG